MSKVKIQGNASGTGVLTIAAPNTNTDRTITLPDGTGTLLNSNGDGSSLTNLPGGGKVLQVVSMSTTSSTSTTSTSNQSTACTLSITLTNSANKVLVMTTGQVGSDTSYREGALSLYRDSTNILSDFVVTITTSGSYTGFPAPCTYLDTPGASSATYMIKCRQAGSSGSTIFNKGGYTAGNTTQATMVLMEIEV